MRTSPMPSQIAGIEAVELVRLGDVDHHRDRHAVAGRGRAVERGGGFARRAAGSGGPRGLEVATSRRGRG